MSFFHLAATAGDAPFQFLHPLRYWGYQWWSGAGSDLSEITLLGIAIGAAKHKNCRHKGCWRLGHAHPDHGRPVCSRHFHAVKRPDPKEL